MPHEFTPKVVTANALLEGDVVYQTADDRWSRHLFEAELIIDEALANLRLAQAEGQPELVVGACLADAKPSESGPQPTHFREELRRTGPSNYHHGKQAEAN